MTDSTGNFEEKEMDVSINRCCWLLCASFTFGAMPYSTVLYLGKEEVTKTDVDLCGVHISKRPYGELGSVDRSTCLCCVSVDSAFGPISPGCGCDAETVDELVVLLKERMRTRGDTAQIQRAEQTLKRLDEVDAKLDQIMAHLNIPKPDKILERD